MKRILPTLLCLLTLGLSAQVGVGNTNPQAQLDISASNTSSPSNLDGILIPRMSNLPTVGSMTAAQDGMLVFYTGSGNSGKGFYYWNQTSTSWVYLSSGSKNTLDGAYDEGGAGAGRVINANDGNVEISGSDGLQVTTVDTDTNAAAISIYSNFDGNGNHGINNQVWGDAGAGNGRTAFAIDNYIRTLINDGTVYGMRSQFVLGNNAGSSLNSGNVGVFNQFYSGTNTGFNIGVQNEFRFNSTVHYGMKNTNFLSTAGTTYGMHNDFDSNGSSDFYGSYNSFNMSGTSDIYGSYNSIVGAGSGNKYGTYVTIPSGGGGNHYGIYTDVRNTSGYAAYLIGRTSLGTGTSNRYLMPETAGTNGQIMAINGSGVVSFVNPSAVFSDTDTDDQTIDNLTLVGTTLGISLEDDGQPVQTVDLSSLQDGIGTDNQTIDTFSFNAATNVLSLEIENDGVATQTVDLSSLDTEDADWHEVGTSSSPNAITDNIFTLGDVGIGSSNIGSYTTGSRTLTVGPNNTASAIDASFIELVGTTGQVNSSVGGIHIENTSGSSFGDGIAKIEAILNGSTNFAGHLLFYTGSTSGNLTEKMRIEDNGDVGIGVTNPSATLDLVGSFQYVDGNQALGRVLTSDANGNATWSTTSAIDNTTASNGLSEVSDDIKLGGTLTQATIITQDTNSFDINLNSTGDFAIQDNGTDAFFVEDSGDVGFGTSNPAYQVDVSETGNNELRGVNVTKTDNSSSDTNGIYVTKTGSGTGRSHAYYSLVQGSGTGQKYGIFNRINSTAAGNQYGTRNWISGNTTSQQFGTFNNMDNAGTSNVYGVYNGMRVTNASNMYGVYNEFLTANNSSTLMAGVRNRFTNGTPGSDGFAGIYTDFALTANGTYYGTRNEYGSGATGTGTKYGTYNEISSSAGGTHYGSYNDVSTSNGWAGYFLGRNYISDRLSIGETDNANARFNVQGNSSSTYAHIELEETGTNDGSRIRFTNSVETTNNWLIYGRADNTDADSRMNIFYSNTGNIIEIYGDNTVEVNGQLSVNLNNPTYAIHLPNNAAIGTGQGRANAWTTYSDNRVKSNQSDLKNGLLKVMQMRPKTYFHHNGNIENGTLNLDRSGEQTLGFIAQELYKVLPEAVQKPQNENKELWSINYDKVIPVTVKAIQELNEEIQSLKEENKTLRAKLDRMAQLEARLLAIEKQINHVTDHPVSASADE
ncbi:tail fiber domain-containing protein [Winogradskyella tangerina]|uniref:tail fiber domain-containing protein n=1 Tax=Winogradskyella tangerina TaxID=2023240 RepID=UPI000DBE1FB6|nr:tail fiber domain-containing protein [Winogradskyella tangerina]